MKRLVFVALLFLVSIFVTPSIFAEEESLPEWIKNNFTWFAEGTISETEVLGAIKFLVQNKIIEIEKEPQVRNITITLEEVEFWAEVENSDGEKEVAYVELHQWEPNIIVVNKGDTVILDVKNPRKHIHSLSVPAFGARTDTLEPRTGEDVIQFVADKAGTFDFICSTPYVPQKNYCDPDHNMMTGTLIVLD